MMMPPVLFFPVGTRVHFPLHAILRAVASRFLWFFFVLFLSIWLTTFTSMMMPPGLFFPVGTKVRFPLHAISRAAACQFSWIFFDDALWTPSQRPRFPPPCTYMGCVVCRPGSFFRPYRLATAREIAWSGMRTLVPTGKNSPDGIIIEVKVVNHMERNSTKKKSWKSNRYSS